jgi:hypothetical protein
MEAYDQIHVPAFSTPPEAPSTYQIGGWLDLGVSLAAMAKRKIPTHGWSRNPAFQPLALSLF